VSSQGGGNARRAVLNWTDNSLNETGFVIERMTAQAGVWEAVATVGANVTTYSDPYQGNAVPSYRVLATNVVGDTTVYPAPAIGFPTLTMNSAWVEATGPTGPTGVPTGVTADPGDRRNSGVIVSWVYAELDNTGFTIQRATNSTFSSGVTNINVSGAATRTYQDRQARRGTQYWYRVAAVNGSLAGAWSEAANGGAPVTAAALDPGSDGWSGNDVYLPQVQTEE